MQLYPSRCSTSQTTQSTATGTASVVVPDSCFILPHDLFERRRMVQAFLTIAPGLEYILGCDDNVYICCELAGEQFMEIRSPRALQLIQIIADINNQRLTENELLLLQQNLFAFGSCLPWYPELAWLKSTYELEV